MEHTGDLVAEGDHVGGGEQGAQGAVDDVDVRQADASGLDLDEYLARTGHGDGNLLHDELLAVQMEAPSKHGVQR